MPGIPTGITKVIDDYCVSKGIGTWEGFAKAVVATGQSKSDPFGQTFRGAESKDCAGTKYSFGITNVSGFGVNEANYGLTVTVAGLNETLAVSKGGLNVLKNIFGVGKSETEAAENSKTLARQAKDLLFLS
ncbi:MAG: hypothetical protein LBC51_08740 [Treponema sp.]|jgi:hypothetical protein|nr:hypothetical protein [Treponema sp.]